LDLTRGEDGSIHGRISLGDSPLARSGNVEGWIRGKRVIGTIRGDSGRRIARFKGRVTPRGIRGTYRDRTGEAGTWAWEGTLPQ